MNRQVWGPLLRQIVVLAAVLFMSAGCAESVMPPVPTSTALMPPASPAPATETPAAQPAEHPAVAAAMQWAAGWCGWSWRERFGAREAAASRLMTPAAGAALPRTSAEAWRAEVVDVREVAVCDQATVVISAGGSTSGRAYVSLSAERTVRNDVGVTSHVWREDRRVVLVGGRWLIDAAVAGG